MTEKYKLNQWFKHKESENLFQFSEIKIVNNVKIYIRKMFNCYHGYYNEIHYTLAEIESELELI